MIGIVLAELLLVRQYVLHCLLQILAGTRKLLDRLAFYEHILGTVPDVLDLLDATLLEHVKVCVCYVADLVYMVATHDCLVGRVKLGGQVHRRNIDKLTIGERTFALELGTHVFATHDARKFFQLCRQCGY